MKHLFILVFAFILVGSINAQSWNQSQYIYPDPGGNTSYGKGLAMDAEYTFVGAPTHYNGGGNVTIYKNDYNTDSLLFHQTLSNPGGFVFNGFGASISIDGEYAVVGANLEKRDTAGINPIIGAGAAYVFKKDSIGVWSFYQKIVPNTRIAGMGFGKTVAISDNRIMVGAADGSGVYSFLLNANGEWVQSQNIADANSVSISGNKAVLGNSIGIDLSSNINTGIAILYEFDTATDTWQYVDSIRPENGFGGDWFGTSVSINNNRIIVGAVNHSFDLSSNSMNSAGAAYIYEIDNTNTVIFDQKLVAASRKINAHFGSSVAIYKNLCTVAADRDSASTGPMGDVQTRGASYTYRKSSSWTNVMTEYGGQIGESFGSTIAINNVFQITSALPFDMGQDNEPNGFIRIYKNDQPLIDTTNIVECYLYTDSNGVFYGTSVDFYEFADNNSNSQDLYFNDLQINNPVNNIVEQTCGLSYTSPSGDYTWTQNGIYYDTIVLTGNVCDSVIRIDLSFNVTNTSVMISGDSLIASTDSNITNYQWLSCDNNYSIITNETSNIYVPIDNGLYSVSLVSDLNCVDTSACYFITSIQTLENKFTQSINIYPNPNKGSVNIDFEDNQKSVHLSIVNLLGENIYSKEYSNTNNIKLSLNTSAGIYIIKMVNDIGETASIKIIVE